MIKNILRWTGLFVLLFTLQTTLMPLIGVFGVKPDLLILALCFFAFKTDVIPALFMGFLLGLVQDFYAPEILGQNALAKTVIGFFVGLFNEKVMRIDPIFQLAIILFAFILHDSIFYGVDIFKSGLTLQLFGAELVTTTLPRALYTLVFALIPIFSEYVLPSVRR